MKKLFDFFSASLLFIMLFPVFVFLSILIYFKNGSPIFFLQRRPGLNGEIFTLYKFRTMTSEKDKSGAFRPDSDRMTIFGSFLRSSSLDEIPSLINVIKGDMSLVGPRPLLVQYLPLYSREQFRRHLVKPGITGLAQVNGRNGISWEQKFEYDIYYVDNQSFWLDIKILSLTLKKVFVREGISADGHVTTEPFEGNLGADK